MSDIPELERIRFFQNQLLTADDLTDLDDNNRELRWLHNRSLHNWGIGLGLDVQGLRGATFVTVNPGYAVDILGREIILSEPIELPIPAVSGGASGGAATYYLVANYLDDSAEPTEEQRAATVCAAGGSVRLSNDPAILWKTDSQLKCGIDVILAQVFIQNCVLSLDASAAPRRYATCGQSMYIKAAEVLARDISWKIWKQGGVDVGFTATIDTSHAKFQTTPLYIAHIIGNRSLSSPALTVADFVSVANDSPRGFTLQVALPPMAVNVNPASMIDAVKGPLIFNQLGWRVSWMGVEG
jgi:hypothetical protein